MKPSELNEILKDVIAEELAIKEWIGHPDDEPSDGYTNDYQRAFAHSQATNPVPEGDKKKAEDLAKKGKFVVIANNDVHCKTTDAVLGSCISIEGIFDTYEEAEKKANDIGSYMDGVGVITPDSVNNPPSKEHSYPPPGTEDDVPFQEALGLSIKNTGVGGVKPLTGHPGVKGLAQNTKGFDTDRFSKSSPLSKYRWKDGMHKALETLNRRLKQVSLGSPSSVIQGVQDQFGLSDHETYLVAATSNKPPTPEEWNKMGSKYARFVGTRESVKEVNATTDSSGKTIAAVGAPGSVARFTTENPDAIKQMKDWALDCQWMDQEDIEEMGDEEILRGVQRHYEGGIKQFLRDANSKAEVPIGYKENDNSKVKTFREIKNELDPDGTKHDLTLTCSKCGTTETCRCSKPKRKYEGVCDKCSVEEGYGMGDMAKDPKKAFKGARWTVKYDENSKISVNEVKSIIKEIISEVLNENESGWNPLPLPQDANQIAKLMYSLKEGTSIFFCYDNKTGHSADWIEVQNIANGEYMTWVVLKKSEEKEEFESEEEITALAKEIATGGYHYYSIQAIEGYRKHPHPEDDQAIGSYEINGPDPITPQFEARQLHEAKGKTSKDKLRSIINESVASVLQESYPDSQLKIKKIFTLTSTALNRTSTMEPHEVSQLLKQIYLLAHELLDDRVQPTFTNKSWGDLTKDMMKIHNEPNEGKTALGVTQETIRKTKNVLEQMLFQKRNK